MVLDIILAIFFYVIGYEIWVVNFLIFDYKLTRDATHANGFAIESANDNRIHVQSKAMELSVKALYHTYFYILPKALDYLAGT